MIYRQINQPVQFYDIITYPRQLINCGSILVRCLAHIQAQDFPSNVHTVNCSSITDRTGNIPDSFSHKENKKK